MQKKDHTREITFPRVAPHKKTEDYLFSKAFLNHVQFRSYEWDKPRHDPDLHLSAGRRIYFKTEEVLAKKREFFIQERIKLEAQWKDLQEKEEKLKDTFMKMSSFVRGNAEKRIRAKTRTAEDKLVQLERIKQIENIKEKIHLINESKVEMDENICHHKIYEIYLDQVVGEFEGFRNADDIINRYESLIATKNVLGKRQNEMLRELEIAQAKILKLTEENGFKILGLNNTVQSLNSRYQTALAKALHWETVVTNIKKACFEKFQEINEVKQACNNLCVLMCKRKGETLKIAEDDFEKQLNYIKKTLEELKNVKQMIITGRKSDVPTRRQRFSNSKETN